MSTSKAAQAAQSLAAEEAAYAAEQTRLEGAFEPVLRLAVEALLPELAAHVHNVLTLDYGSTDCGQQYVALCADSLPAWSRGHGGGLVFFLCGAGVPGFAVIMKADGSTLKIIKTAADLGRGMEVAKKAGATEYRRLTVGSGEYRRHVVGAGQAVPSHA